MVALPIIQPDLHQRILDNLNLVVLLFDPDLTLVYANPAAEMLMGMSANRLIGRRLDELITDKVCLQEQIEEAVASNHPFSRHEVVLRLINEDDVTVDLTVNVLQDSVGKTQVLLEMLPIDRMLRITREEAIVEQQATVQGLVRGLAHEIKNPLGGLRGAAQLLERELDKEEQKEYTRVIIDEADRLQKLVNRLLGPSGMPRNTKMNVHEAIEYVRNIVINNKPEINFIRDYDPSVPEIVGDQDLLVQAILNIVNNAIEAMNDKGNLIVRTRIVRNFTISQKTRRLVIRLDIVDEGPGIPEDIKDKIFFPMITGRAEGTGLGLSIAQRLVQQHSGLIECESEPGKTIFSIYLPIDNGNEET
ncbi:MAG: nitrogen regulation protein NR(II) [Thioalkalispiraceae bacterium]|jgi:two-component system nitrogen regulation sensor histidine kinase GlnL